MPATTCAALVNSMPRRIKAVLDNNGALKNIDTLGHSFDMFSKFVLLYKLHIDYSKIYPNLCSMFAEM